MSLAAMTWAFSVQGITPAQKCVLLALADHADDDGKCWPSIRRLEKKTCMTRRGLTLAIGRFEASGLLVRERSKDGKSSTRYTLSVGRELSSLGNPVPWGRELSSLGVGNSVPPNLHLEPSVEPSEKDSPSKPHQREPDEEAAQASPCAVTADAATVRPRVVTIAGFERWWAECPRKIGKAAASRKFTTIVKAGQVTVDELIDGMRRYASHVRANAIEPQFVVHPATWLNQGRWQDDLSTDERTENVRRRSEPYVSPAAQIITEHLRSMDYLPDDSDRPSERSNTREPPGKVVALHRRS